VKWAGFRVSDTGTGISPEELPHLFNRFYRGKTGRDSGVLGTGLGLAIAKEIVERHHGVIEVVSSGQDKGAEFSVWLPLIAD
jgi:signal transduction histidine kinase